MDFRLTGAIDNWLEDKKIMNDCDMISVAGISKAIADDANSESAKFLLNQIGLSLKLHNIKTLYLMHHTDCGAYGGHKAFANLEEEMKKYQEDMSKSASLIKAKFPKLEVKSVVADIKDDGGMEIKEL